MKPADGVYFRRADYAGFWRRLLVDLVDGLTILVICVILSAAVWLVHRSGNLILNSWAAAIFSYYVLLKRWKGTLGYRFGGVRTVGQDGQPASISALTVRLLFGVLGPLNWLLDLVWLSSDPHRQALRDKLAGTYVVMRRAVPAGRGKIVYRPYEILFYSFLFREVETRSPAAFKE